MQKDKTEAFIAKLRKRKSLTYPRFNKTVKVGDVLTVKWENGKVEKLKVAEFSVVSNQPIDDTGKTIYLDYVVWD